MATVNVSMTEREAAEVFMTARGFKFDQRTKLWINPKLEPGGVHDDNIVQCLRFAAANGHIQQRSPTRADIIDMLRQLTGVAEQSFNFANTFPMSARVSARGVVERARRMVDSFKLPAR